MKLLCILVLLITLVGCAGTPLHPEPVTVAGKTITYVKGTDRVGILGDEVLTCDRYDENGKLTNAQCISITGTVHDAMKAAAGSTGTAALVTPTITPVINAVEGK